MRLKVNRGPHLNSHLEKRLPIEIPRWSPFSRNIHSCLQSHAIIVYAGDFNLITSNKITHERLINERHSINSSKNLTLKPEKCKNLSICSGSPKIVPFSLGGKHLDSISPMKWACASFQSISMEGFTFIRNKIETMLKNIEATYIYAQNLRCKSITQYAMSSIRFALTVHDLTSIHLKEIVRLTHHSLPQIVVGNATMRATSAIIIIVRLV